MLNNFMNKTNKYLNDIKDLKYSFNDYYCLSYLSVNEYHKALNCLSLMREDKIIDGNEYYILREVFKHQHSNHDKIKELIRKSPRIHAQRFINKKNIRNFIFERDNNKCLCCGTSKLLTIDHIHPIYYGGKNKISNLQTLCKSCNSRKGTSFYDYR